MLSLRSSGKIVGSSVSIRQLAQEYHRSSPISLRELLQALGVRDSLIKHVFVLMLENRSFDHMLGFSGITGTGAATGQPTTIDGLTGTETNSFTDSAGIVHTHQVETGAADVIDPRR
jgi:phospholipase C